MIAYDFTQVQRHVATSTLLSSSGAGRQVRPFLVSSQGCEHGREGGLQVMRVSFHKVLDGDQGGDAEEECYEDDGHGPGCAENVVGGGVEGGEEFDWRREDPFEDGGVDVWETIGKVIGEGREVQRPC
jgi:hypothetical protein